MSQQAKILRASAKRGDPSDLFGPWAAKKKPYIYQGSLHIFVIVNNVEIVNELLTDLLFFPWWGQRLLRMRACQLTWLSFIRKSFMHFTSSVNCPTALLPGMMLTDAFPHSF